MPTALDHSPFKPGTTCCSIDGRLVFLDVRKDRYFRVSPDLEHGLRDLLANKALPPAALLALRRAGLEEIATSLLPVGPLPHATHTAQRINQGPCSLADILRALFSLRRARKDLAVGSLAQTLQAMDQFRGGVAQRPADAGHRMLRAFEMTKLVVNPADLCLPRSIAVVRCLAALGVRASLVLGVKLDPFAAHAWAQWEDEVLNDTVEEVVKYTPILIV